MKENGNTNNTNNTNDTSSTSSTSSTSNERPEPAVRRCRACMFPIERPDDATCSHCGTPIVEAHDGATPRQHDRRS